MRPEELKMLLHSLLPNWEDEVVEFKRGGKGFSTGEVDEYLCGDTPCKGFAMLHK